MPQYSKTSWVDGTAPAISAANLNKLEQGVFDSIRQDGSTTMSAQLVTIAGTAATPAIAPTGDSNTGIFFPAADNLGLAVGGGEGFRLLANGNVGLSQGNPSVRLALGAVGGQKFNLYDDPSSGIGIGMGIDISGIGSYETTFYSKSNAGGNGQWTWGHLNSSNIFSEKMRITSAGNVGIGTTSPSEKLVVNGNISSLYGIHSTTLYNGNLNFYNAGSSTKYINVSDDSNTIPAISLDKIGSATKTCFLNGNVGIGTTSPTEKLQVNATSGNTGLNINTADSGAVSYISLSNTGASGKRYSLNVGGNTIGSGLSNNLFLYDNDNAAVRFLITPSGNVGIGTTSPAYTLDTNGIVRAKNAFYIGRSTDSAVIGSVKEGTSNGLKIQAESGGTDSTITFATNGVDRAIITSAGNVGIGTTPSTWGSGYTAFSIKNAGNSISSSGASQLLLSSNAYDSGAGAWKYNDNGYYANLMEIGSNGYLFYTTQSTQGAGNPITWSERMRITSAGYLLIGYTSSNGAYPLQVNGQIFATSSTIATSDGRYKKDVVALDGALDIVKALNPVQFNWKEHPVHKFNTDVPTVGFIAQEVEQALADKSYLTSIIKKSECTWETETGETIEREVTRDVEKQVTREVEREVTETIDGEEVTRTITEEVTETIIEQVTEIVTEPVKETHTEEFLGIAESNLIAILTKAVQELNAKVEALEAQLNK